jgi:DNA polymerase/3'-5' exonuclease PolX
MSVKSLIVEAFTLLLQIEKGNKGAPAAAKRKAYQNGLDTMALIPSVTTEEDLKPLWGRHVKVPSSLYLRAQEILHTGTCEVLEEAKGSKAVWDAYEIFLEIHGIGPSLAHDLADRGYRTIEDLKKGIRTNTLVLNRTQMIGLTYHDSIKMRIPREEMEYHETRLKEVAPCSCDIVGSYRRGLESSGDIDMLLCSSDSAMLDTMVKALTESHYIKETLAYGKHKFMGIVKLGKLPFRRLDILLTPPEAYGYAMLYFTGSQRFNILVRQHALTKGYSLNEHTLSVLKDRKSLQAAPPSGGAGEHTLSVDPKWKGPKPVAIPVLKTEAEILAFLGIKWVEPTDREDVVALTFT